MSSSSWMIFVWLGMAILVLFLPAILSSWTGFAIALGLTLLVVWQAFRPRRAEQEDGPRAFPGKERAGD